MSFSGVKQCIIEVLIPRHTAGWTLSPDEGKVPQGIRRVIPSFVGQNGSFNENVSLRIRKLTSLFQQRKKSNTKKPKESRICKPDPESLKTNC